MRTFCTEGPVDPKLNYYVPRTALVAEGLKKVKQWRYFTIFAPRQSGKTTYFQFLIEAIKREKPDWLPVWVSFEAYGDLDLSDFLSSLRDRILRGTELPENAVPDFHNMTDIALKLREVAQIQKKEWVIVVDEIEGLKNPKVLNGFLHLIRSIYHEKQEIGLRSVILTGVSNITGIIQDTASPFNIADQIQVPYFTREEVYDLLAQHERETGQLFENPVKEGIYEQTLGQPGLVNALARDLVEKKCPNGEVVGMDAFYLTVDHFTRVYIDKNISNIVSKAKQHTEIMKEILFGKEVPFNNYDETIKFLYVNGVIDDCDGACCIPIPLYKKALYTCFKPLFNGEKEHFKSPIETYKKYVDERGLLDVTKLLWRYIAYVKNRGNIIFSQGKASEGVYHYNIDAFFSTYAEFADAKCFVETPVGGGRVDLLLLQAGKTDIIEIKRYDADQYEKSQGQLKAYLERSGLSEGHLVMFSEYHEAEGYEKVEAEGKTLHLWIIPVKRPVPSA
ncbi:MAG TPA: AAA-like domain-containing protein [Thermotogota bacterium]|nr:AAA-like domain-containing protein [Thermotogota bacterium]HOF24291.1 AAA-like domain-containing protein [Thermotogota bacterium]HOM55855.1 AAA-like domain-containing protein [Thermotogota bacterium]HOS24874.1 AAA-like domain-containing protein [Thermotogota bacterium]HPD36656.1 AAA-like domain-containing protein [Thermotogota bacterium]